MKWLKQLKLVSLRARAPWIGVCLALAIGIFWGGGCGSLVLCLTPKTLSELTEESLEGAYVADSIPYLHVLYAREEAFRRDEPAGEVLGLYYAIDFGEGRYMGLCVRGDDMSRAERVMSACQVYRYGELPREKIPVLPVSGTVKAMEGGELDCFMALAGENEALAAAMLPYYIDAGRIGPRTVTAQALLALTALAFLLLALFPAVRALSGAYQRQVVAVLSQSWSRSIAAERAGQFYDRTQPVCGVRMGPEHVFFQQGPKSILLRPWDVVWAYQDDLPRFHRQVHAVLLRTAAGGQYALPMDGERAGQLLEAMSQALPGTAIGYTEETERLYQEDRSALSARWEEIRAAKA